MGESTSLSQQQLSFDDEINDNNPPTNQISTGSISDIRKASVTSMGTGATKDFFSNISNDINGLANQTTSMFTDLFGKDSQKKITYSFQGTYHTKILVFILTLFL